MASAPRTITIVGGGIAGHTLAAALDPARFRVSLIEAEPHRHVVGGAIGLWPSARRALVGLGAWDQLAGDCASPDSGALHDLSGRPLLRLPSPDLVLVERPALMAALADAVPDSADVHAAAVTRPEELDGDLVVGADGVRSVVRAEVHPAAAERRATPYVALRGVVDAVRAVDVGEYWGPGGLFGLAPMSDGRGYWFTTHRSTAGPEPLAVDDILGEAREVFRDAAPVIRRTLTEADGRTSATRIWVTPPMPRYVSGRYVVIGDAAHASTPNLGRGGCDAILDAVTLAATLNGGGSLRTWQASRLPVTQAARVAAGGIMRLALLERGHVVRDRAQLTLGRLVDRLPRRQGRTTFGMLGPWTHRTRDHSTPSPTSRGSASAR